VCNAHLAAAISCKKNPPNINNWNLSIYCKSLWGICRRVCFYLFAMIQNLHISVGLFKLRVPTKVTSKRISQANYFYRTSISRTTTHPQYWNLIHIKSIIIFFCSFMKLIFSVSIFNAHEHFFAVSEKRLHENPQKNTENHT